jgi:hypothetical protein
MSFEHAFVEQAEYLETDTFSSWHASHPNEESILRKLCHGGAKLISGPRGCGKTTLLLQAYNQMIGDDNSAFPIYVNYKRSLSLEPLYKSNTEGTFWFNQWVIVKIYQGLYESLEKLGSDFTLSIDKERSIILASMLEMSKTEINFEPTLSVALLESDIQEILTKVARQRCVILLDDAAHSFSPDQQRDFFDFFRQVKSKTISPKAAIYPGVTSYSPSFHIGHDAELIDVLIKPDSSEYLTFMKSILNARFDDKIQESILQNQYSVELLCYASFGIPRALLNMLQTLIESEQDDSGDKVLQINLSRNSVIKAIKQHYQNTKKIFTSLSVKLPVYKKFIETGDKILRNSITLIKEYNKSKPVNKQSISIAISESDLSAELLRVFSFFQYAGLCIPKEETISRGEKGKFRIYTIHYSGLVDSNALLGARSINVQNYVEAFSTRDAHEFTRTKPNPLFDNADHSIAFALSLPPCSVCNTPRAFEEAKFCVKCGSPLSTPSTYHDLLNRDIQDLPLTTSRINKIKEKSTIRKVRDILLDHEHIELLKVDRIGPFWAAKIMRLAEEFVE